MIHVALGVHRHKLAFRGTDFIPEDVIRGQRENDHSACRVNRDQPWHAHLC
jgi:hypothetical protein